MTNPVDSTEGQCHHDHYGNDAADSDTSIDPVARVPESFGLVDWTPDEEGADRGGRERGREGGREGEKEGGRGGREGGRERRRERGRVGGSNINIFPLDGK